MGRAYLFNVFVQAEHQLFQGAEIVMEMTEVRQVSHLTVELDNLNGRFSIHPEHLIEDLLIDLFAHGIQIVDIHPCQLLNFKYVMQQLPDFLLLIGSENIAQFADIFLRNDMAGTFCRQFLEPDQMRFRINERVAQRLRSLSVTLGEILQSASFLAHPDQ
ncbi:hypothetical protein D3C73_1340830 [compost metagenome]